MKNVLKNNWIWFFAVTTFLFVAACSEDEDPIIPVADFNSDVQDKEVTFSNASKDAQSFAWTFGDGNSSTDISPTHTYEDYGDYEVKLVATSSDGSTDEVTKTVSVIDACEIWDGTQTDNLVKGGQFEFCDDKYWTMVKSSQPEHVKYAIGYEDYNPTAGDGGALYIHPDNDATNEDEATVFYQEIEATDGEYQLDALIKLKGENQDNPTSAMTDYWVQFYVGKTAPVDGEDYNDGQASGWIYGAWTGWAYVVPQTDGALVHDLLVANMASSEGKFNLDDGKYYFVVKVGKGGAGSFGDGIAIDNVSLKRVGERNACFDWDGTQSGNYVKGGQFEECDDKYWTIFHADANLPEAPYEFGNTEYAPSTGNSGAFFTPNPTENASSTMYQYIGELDAGTYQLDAQVKLGGVESGMKDYWWEMLVWTEEPQEGVGYSPKDENDVAVPRIAGYIEAGWGGVTDAQAHDGELQYNYTNGNAADAEGKFTIAEKGHYFFVLKWGIWNGSLGDGISVDNISITKVQ